MFPSLTGVIRFLICKNKLFMKGVYLLFPSLTGVIRFLIQTICENMDSLSLPVSVPYRGYSFFNPTLQNPHGYWAQNAFCGAKLFLIGNR